MDFLPKLVALIPPPRKHLTRYHGVFAPNHAWRSRIVPRAPAEVAEAAGSTSAGADSAESTEPTTEETRESVPATVLARRLDWAALLMRVFAIDVLECPRLVERILEHLDLPTEPPSSSRDPPGQWRASA